ncbi:hypothetical protein [Oceanobacillus sp. Castelsardo]|uniref:hypothetical protein n=1 Tax=Oceanobacillus sp. Castelsardo TaxID=1851204 RepID=UPI0008393217|nr:hypothetical protein [Oceanobacillus sp. Castelsardo]
MTRTKWALLLLGVMDLILFMMFLTDYYILFLKPTGYTIPLAINIIALAIIGFRHSRATKWWTIVGLIISIPILFFYSFIIRLEDNSYIKIHSPQHKHSVVIEYRSFTLGETTYYYNFYKTTFGLIGKHLDNQSTQMMIPGTEHPAGLGAEDALGVGSEVWITENTVRFPTWKGMKEVRLDPLESLVSAADIEAFMEKAENKEGGETITVNGNSLTVRYDQMSGQSWIDVMNDKEEGAIPRQQCSRIIADEERGYYMLEECTHRWEYMLYPMGEKD